MPNKKIVINIFNYLLKSKGNGFPLMVMNLNLWQLLNKYSRISCFFKKNIFPTGIDDVSARLVFV